MDKKDQISESFCSGIRVTEQAVVEAGMMVIGTDIHRHFAAAPFADALPCVFFQRKISAEKFHKQIIGYASAFSNRAAARKPIHNFFFAAQLQIYFVCRKELLDFKNGRYFSVHRRI